MTPVGPTPGAAARVVARRRAERERLLDLARSYVADLDPDLGVTAAVVVGSVARGDFNIWSDVDVLVLAEHLPSGWWDRLVRLHQGAPPGLSLVPWTAEEFGAKLARRDILATEAVEHGVLLVGALPADPESRR
ncbi:MAG: nucleotidyltransferase domain-containing protein [Acidimicrobiales bacterium]